jgi:hypothetical protein
MKKLIQDIINSKEQVNEAVHPDALHVSHVGNGKYKVHAVGKNFEGGIKVGEHVTDTELDDFTELGGKIKNIKQKTVKESAFGFVMKQGTSKQAYLGSRMTCPTCNKPANKGEFRVVNGKPACKDCQDDLKDMKSESVIGSALSAVRSALTTDHHKKQKKVAQTSAAANAYDKIKEESELEEMAKRGRPRKNPLPIKKAGSDEDDDYGPDTGPEADKNIQNQLKKAVDSKDTKGGAHVEFEDGKKHFVKSEHAHKVLHAMNQIKPADRAKVQDHIYKSHDNFTAVHSMLK